MATRIPQDLARVRGECDRDLARYPAQRRAVRSILDKLDDLWSDPQGVPADLAARIDTLVPHFDALERAVTQAEIERAVDGLVRAYDALGFRSP